MDVAVREERGREKGKGKAVVEKSLEDWLGEVEEEGGEEDEGESEEGSAETETEEEEESEYEEVTDSEEENGDEGEKRGLVAG